GPKQEGANTTDGDADFVGFLANRLKFSRARFGREIVVKVVIELDAVESRLFGQTQALLQAHFLRVGERPLVDRFLHRVALAIVIFWRGGLVGRRAIWTGEEGSTERRGRSQQVATAKRQRWIIHGESPEQITLDRENPQTGG